MFREFYAKQELVFSQASDRPKTQGHVKRTIVVQKEKPGERYRQLQKLRPNDSDIYKEQEFIANEKHIVKKEIAQLKKEIAQLNQQYIKINTQIQSKAEMDMAYIERYPEKSKVLQEKLIINEKEKSIQDLESEARENANLIKFYQDFYSDLSLADFRSSLEQFQKAVHEESEKRLNKKEDVQEMQRKVLEYQSSPYFDAVEEQKAAIKELKKEIDKQIQVRTALKKKEDQYLTEQQKLQQEIEENPEIIQLEKTLVKKQNLYEQAQARLEAQEIKQKQEELAAKQRSSSRIMQELEAKEKRNTQEKQDKEKEEREREKAKQRRRKFMQKQREKQEKQRLEQEQRNKEFNERIQKEMEEEEKRKKENKPRRVKGVSPSLFSAPQSPQSSVNIVSPKSTQSAKTSQPPTPKSNQSSTLSIPMVEKIQKDQTRLVAIINLPAGMARDDLISLMSQAGELEALTLSKKVNKGAKAQYMTKDGAENAVAMLDGKDINGSKIGVILASSLLQPGPETPPESSKSSQISIQKEEESIQEKKDIEITPKQAVERALNNQSNNEKEEKSEQQKKDDQGIKEIMDNKLSSLLQKQNEKENDEKKSEPESISKRNEEKEEESSKQEESNQNNEGEKHESDTSSVDSTVRFSNTNQENQDSGIDIVRTPSKISVSSTESLQAQSNEVVQEIKNSTINDVLSQIVVDSKEKETEKQINNESEEPAEPKRKTVSWEHPWNAKGVESNQPEDKQISEIQNVEKQSEGPQTKGLLGGLIQRTINESVNEKQKQENEKEEATTRAIDNNTTDTPKEEKKESSSSDDFEDDSNEKTAQEVKEKSAESNNSDDDFESDDGTSATKSTEKNTDDNSFDDTFESPRSKSTEQDEKSEEQIKQKEEEEVKKEPTEEEIKKQKEEQAKNTAFSLQSFFNSLADKLEEQELAEKNKEKEKEKQKQTGETNWDNIEDELDA